MHCLFLNELLYKRGPHALDLKILNSCGFFFFKSFFSHIRRKNVSVFLYSEVKGNLILHLKPEPLPTMSDQLQDEELDLSMERENQGETENPQVPDTEICSSGTGT